MSNIDQAREWAERRRNISDTQLNAGVKAAAEIIQSLPDQWVDVEKVRELADDMSNWSIPGMLDTTDSVRLSQMMDGFIDRLNALIAPKPPTLADMTPEERKACQWMQAKTSHEVGIIVWVDEDSETAHLVTRADGVLERKFKDVTPLPGEPKLEWPGGVVDCEIVDEPETADSTPIHTPMQPSEVPPNEPWLIEVDNEKAIGTRYAIYSAIPWSVALLDGSFAGDYHDSDVTLIHKLVPETHTLPEGMRLADHALYGRVVVAPRANTHGEESYYRLAGDSACGASHGYRPTEELNFLDGNQ